MGDGGATRGGGAGEAREERARDVLQLGGELLAEVHSCDAAGSGGGGGEGGGGCGDPAAGAIGETISGCSYGQ